MTTTMTKEEAAGYIEQLRQASIAAVQSRDFTHGVNLANAARMLTEWLNGGMRGEPPAETLTLLPPLPAAQHEAGAATPEADPAAPAIVAPQRITQMPEPDKAGEQTIAPAEFVPPKAVSEIDVEQRLALARGKAREGDYNGALADLEALAGEAAPAQQESLNAEIDTVKAQREKRAQQLIRTAKRTATQQVNNVGAQRTAWQNVLTVDADNRDALEALNQLQLKEIEIRQSQEIDKLRDPLRANRKDLREVEKARNRADQLRTSGEIRNPDTRKLLEDTYERLSELRNQILRASEGGASNERNQNYEVAIDKYTKALDAGYDVIRDDVTGEGTNVVEALNRTRSAYWAYLRKRIGDRQQAAAEALRGGYPETAATRLEEAYELVKKIQEGGGDDRRAVEDDLARAREALKSKQAAQRLVSDAESNPDPEVARAKLVEARQIYPGYPNLDEYIAAKDSLVLGKAVENMRADLAAARGALGRGAHAANEPEGRQEFERAREHCRTAMNRGANLTVTSAERDGQRQAAQEVLAEINKSEQAFQIRMRQLDEVNAAIDARNTGLAESLLAAIGAGEDGREDARLQALRMKLTQIKDDDLKLVDAERFFYEGQDFSGVVKICGGITNPALRDRARMLMWRAQARLNLSQARDNRRTGKLEAAISSYQQVESLKKELPPEDHGLCQQAETERARTQEERKQEGDLRRRLEATRAMRKQPLVDWASWMKTVESLRAAAPEWLRAEVDGEYDEGKKAWADGARSQAAGYEVTDIHQAFRTLETAVGQGLIPASDPVWRRIEFGYYTARADEALNSARQEDLVQAESFASQARNAAPKDKLQKATEYLLAVIRAATLKRAEIAGAMSNPGPEGAIQILEDKIKEYSILATDAVIRGRLLRYTLVGGYFDKAREQAAAMAYVSGEEAWARQWQQLAQAGRDMAEGRMAQAVSALLDSRKRITDQASPALLEMHQDMTRRAVDELRRTTRVDTLAISNEEMVKQIQALEHLRQLDPSDEEAEKQLRQMAMGLGSLIEPLRRRSDALSLGADQSLRQALQSGQALLGDVRAVHSALVSTGGLDGAVRTLSGVITTIQPRIEEWQSAAEALDQLQAAWSKVIGGNWDTKGLDEYLDLARRAGDAKEVEEWDKRITTLKECLNGARRDPNNRGLRALIQDARKAWDDEQLDALVSAHGRGLISELKAKITQTRRDLNEPTFVIPRNELTFFDEFSNQHMTDLDDVRDEVLAKQSNLTLWETWERGWSAPYSEFDQRWTQIVTWLESKPPCLTLARKSLEPMEAAIQALQKKVDEQPNTMLSHRAKEIADQYPARMLHEGFERLTSEVKQKQQRVAELSSAMEHPLSRLQDFRTGKRPLSSKANVRALRKIIDELKSIDACHPDIEEFEKPLGRFGDG